MQGRKRDAYIHEVSQDFAADNTFREAGGIWLCVAKRCCSASGSGLFTPINPLPVTMEKELVTPQSLSLNPCFVLYSSLLFALWYSKALENKYFPQTIMTFSSLSPD